MPIDSRISSVRFIRDCATRLLERIVTLLPYDVRLSVSPGVRDGRPCDDTVHFSADLTSWLDNPIFWAPPPTVTFYQCHLEER